MRRLRNFRHGWLTLFCLGLLMRVLVPDASPAEGPRPEPVEGPALGPLFQEFKLTLDPGRRTEVLGPLYYYQETGEPGDLSRQWAVPPIFSYWRNDDVDYVQLDIFWKGITYNRYGQEYRFAILEIINSAGGLTQSETNVDRVTLFPFYFQQRSAIPEKNYTALFPIYGTLKERLFRNEIRFALFPLWGRSRKRDVVTDNFLYPIFHLRHGNGLEGWQFWPLMGAEQKEVTFRTNIWNEAEPIAGHEKFMVLWPIFFSQRTGIGSTNEARQQMVLPLYNYIRSPDRDLTSYLWPIGVTHIEDRAKRFNEWGTPWPLIVFARGEGKTVSRVWPFYSQAHNATQTSSWILWPIYKYNRLNSAPLDRERTRILFFLYSDVSARQTEDKTRQRQFDLWPLFTSKREFDGRRRLQILAPLEPILPNNTGVERNLSPLWSLWRSEKNPKTGASSQSLLWNLYRRDVTREQKKSSLLFGLFQYQSGPDGGQWRLFHIPMGRRQPVERPATASR
jgi:hypothetical protein